MTAPAELNYTYLIYVSRHDLECEHELQQAATELTIRACQQEVERRGPDDRRQTTRRVEVDRRLTPTRRDTDLATVSPTPR